MYVGVIKIIIWFFDCFIGLFLVGVICIILYIDFYFYFIIIIISEYDICVIFVGGFFYMIDRVGDRIRVIIIVLINDEVYCLYFYGIWINIVIVINIYIGF